MVFMKLSIYSHHAFFLSLDDTRARISDSYRAYCETEKLHPYICLPVSRETISRHSLWIWPWKFKKQKNISFIINDRINCCDRWQTKKNSLYLFGKSFSKFWYKEIAKWNQIVQGISPGCRNLFKAASEEMHGKMALQKRRLIMTINTEFFFKPLPGICHEHMI